MEPTNPIKAVSHGDPYPYYRRLLAGPPLYFDQELWLWVAVRANVVSQIFDSPACRVRPVAEPIPAALNGLPAGEIFEHLVRMNDGRRHDRPKLALQRALASIPASEVATRARHAATRATMPIATDPGALTAWAFDTPTSVVGNLAGIHRRRVFSHFALVGHANSSPAFRHSAPRSSCPRQASRPRSCALWIRADLLDSINLDSGNLVCFRPRSRDPCRLGRRCLHCRESHWVAVSNL